MAQFYALHASLVQNASSNAIWQRSELIANCMRNIRVDINDSIADMGSRSQILLRDVIRIKCLVQVTKHTWKDERCK